MAMENLEEEKGLRMEGLVSQGAALSSGRDCCFLLRSPKSMQRDKTTINPKHQDLTV
jgi:hypothetical protein